MNRLTIILMRVKIGQKKQMLEALVAAGIRIEYINFCFLPAKSKLAESIKSRLQ